MNAAQKISALDNANSGEHRFNAVSIDLPMLWSTIMRWRWLLIGSLLVTLIIAALYTYFATPQYRAMATLEIRQQRVQLLEGSDVEAVAVRDPQFMETQFALLRSGSLAQRVARDIRLANNPVLDLPRGLTPEAREGYAIRYITQGINIAQVGNSRLVSITFVGDNPQVAAEIANSYVQNFIRSDSDRRVATTASARRLLSERVNSAKIALENSERALVDYAQREDIVEINPISSENGDSQSSAAGSLDATQLVATNTALSQAITERITAQQRYEQARAAGISREALDSSSAQSLRTQLAELEAQYTQQAQTYLDTYPAQQALRSRIREIQGELRNQEGQYLRTLRADYQAALSKEAELRSETSRLTGRLSDTRSRSIQYNILRREVDTNRQLYDALLQRFKEIGIAGQIDSDLASPVDPAVPPSRPFSPNLLFNLLLALGGGIVVGGALIFLAYVMDDTIKTPEDIRNKLRLTCLGAIPLAENTQSFMEANDDAQSQVSEAHFSARSAIDFATSNGAPRSIAITSSSAGEGKSSTAVGLAKSFAKNGRRVLIIDADMRRPTMTFADGSGSPPQQHGLSVLLTTNDPLADHIMRTTMDNVFALSAGPIPPNPAELLSTARMVEVIRKAEEAFDLVIIDAPPVMGLADAPVIGGVCEALVFVVKSASTRRKVVIGALNRLAPSGANIIGALLTQVASHGGGYYYYNNVYSYRYAGGRKDKGQDRKLPILKA